MGLQIFLNIVGIIITSMSFIEIYDKYLDEETKRKRKTRYEIMLKYKEKMKSQMYKSNKSRITWTFIIWFPGRAHIAWCTGCRVFLSSWDTAWGSEGPVPFFKALPWLFRNHLRPAGTSLKPWRWIPVPNRRSDYYPDKTAPYWSRLRLSRIPW